MSTQDKQNLSAQVILRPASGKRTLSPEQITAENVHEMMPSAADAGTAQRFFANAGFDVSGVFGNSFSITGEQTLFEKIFGTKIFTNEKRAIKARSKTDGESSELPSNKLPEDVKKTVETVTFTEPPDFGPTNF